MNYFNKRDNYKRTIMINNTNPLSSPEDSDIFEESEDNKNFEFLHFARKRGLIDKGKLNGIPASRLAQVSKPQDDTCLVCTGKLAYDDPLAVWRFMEKFYSGKYFPDNDYHEFSFDASDCI
jgi:hypothetical protein